MVMTTPIVACITCKHFTGGHSCVAFPEGIPSDILNGESYHIRERSGDGGRQYEPMDGQVPTREDLARWKGQEEE